jgi:DNA-binding transcriptional LysR family regulator
MKHAPRPPGEQRSGTYAQPVVVGQDQAVDFDLAQIRAFVAAAEELHFGRAAARLFLSQQGLSKRIQRLEQMIGDPLFLRRHNLVELTAAGRRLLPHARRLLATAEETAADLWPTARPLRVDVWGQIHVPLRIVRRLAAQLPQLVPELSMRRSLSAALDALERDEIDVAFGRPYDLGRAVPSGLALQPLYLDPVSVVMSTQHPLAGTEVLTVDHLRGTGLWWPLQDRQGELLGYLRRYGAQFGIPITTDGLNLGIDHLVDAIRADPERVALIGTEWPLPPNDGIRIVAVKPIPRFLWWTVHHKDARHPQLARFLGLIAELRRRERWVEFDPDRDWLPDSDRADLLT